MDKEERVIITRMMMGICHMQVCTIHDATDEEILEVCNRENPSGTQHGWGRVIRELDENDSENMLPRTCDDNPGRIHFLISC